MKKIIAIIITAIMMFTFTGCNAQIIDTTWKYNKAIIQLPNGEIVEGNIKSWKDYENCDGVQITMEDGSTYYTFLGNVALIS